MDRNTDVLARSLITASNPLMKKSSLQLLCENLERGIAISNKLEYQELIIAAYFNGDPKVRRWAYKATALAKLDGALVHLLYKIREDEDDEENRSWAFAALFALGRRNEVLDLIRQGKLHFFGSSLELAALLYDTHGLNLEIERQTSLFNFENDPIMAKWFCLLYGYSIVQRSDYARSFMDRSAIKAIQGHDDPEVAEYAVWAFHKSEDGSAADLRAPLHELHVGPPNIRRWSYRLALKQKGSPSHLADFVEHSIGFERGQDAAPAK